MFLSIGAIFLVIPEAPIRRDPLADQCANASAVARGAPLPRSLSLSGEGVCGAVCFPTSVAADFMDMQAYSEELYTVCSVDIATMKSENDLLLEELQRPIPLTEQPSFNRWVGRGEGVLAGVLLGLAAFGIYQGGANGD